MFIKRIVFCALVSSFIAPLALAQNQPPAPYELMLFENSHFRNYTYEELKSKISIHQDAIDLNVCNGNEKLLLPDLIKSNPKRNSLKILNSKTNQTITYIDGELFDDAGQKVAIESVKDKYTKTIIGFIEQLRQFPEGSRLITLLQQVLYPMVIAKTGGPRFEVVGSTGKSFSVHQESTIMQHFAALRKSGETEDTFKQFGAGGFVRFDPSFKDLANIESDNKKRASPILSAFAHELFHGFDSVRGLMDRRGVVGEGYEFTEVTEYRAVFFENIVRKNLGRKYRKYYSDVDLDDPNLAKGTMLDKNGEPYLMPTPCLK